MERKVARATMERRGARATMERRVARDTTARKVQKDITVKAKVKGMAWIIMARIIMDQILVQEDQFATRKI